jgi:hypothetical protein
MVGSVPAPLSRAQRVCPRLMVRLAVPAIVPHRMTTTEPESTTEPEKVSDRIDGWLGGEGDKTLGSLIEVFEEKSFAVLFVFLLGVPALPLPTGGATLVFEVIAVLLALQLTVGRDEIWLPDRWRRLGLAGPKQQRFLGGLVKLIRRLERVSRPRGRLVFGHRASNAVFGLLVIAGSAGAFFAPPFTGLDTLPALGVVLLSLGVLLEDIVVALVGTAIAVAGAFVEILLGKAAIDAVQKLF